MVYFQSLQTVHIPVKQWLYTLRYYFTHVCIYYMHLTRFIFSLGNSQDLKLLMLLCMLQKLRHLNMAYVRHLNYKVLLNLLPSLNTLVVLDLRMTLTVDEVRLLRYLLSSGNPQNHEYLLLREKLINRVTLKSHQCVGLQSCCSAVCDLHVFAFMCNFRWWS